MQGLLLILALVGGCAHRANSSVDPTLPDGEPLEAVPARRILEEAASDVDPRVRGLAVSGLVRVEQGEGLVRWSMQGLHDPDPWVQGRVTAALIERKGEPEVRRQLQELVLRGSADPYVRLMAADAVPDLELGPLRGSWKGQETWREAPLALLAWRAGEAEALDALGQALATGEVREEAGFMVAVGRLGRAELVGPLQAGATRLEEEVSVPFAVARALLGDAEGLRVWSRAAHSEDRFVQQGAVELLLALGEEAAAWASRVGAGRDTAEGLALLRAPRGARLVRGAASRDPWVQELAVRLVGQADAAHRSQALAVALGAEDDAVRIAACEAVARYRDTEQAAAVQALLTDDRSAVRVAAAGAVLALPALIP